MILIGDDLVPYEDIFYIKNIEEIGKTRANSTVIFSFSSELLKYSFENDIFYGVIVNSLKEAIYANSLNAKYIICQKDLAIKIQKIADNYMFDSKILAIIDTNEELEMIALSEIDGVIYKKLLL